MKSAGKLMNRLPSAANVVALLSIAVALAMGGILIHFMGVAVTDAWDAFAEGAWGSPYSIGASLNRSLAFALVGLGFILANRANLTNVGGEGQIAVGGMACTAVALHGHVSTLPLGLSYLLPMLAAMCAGALWGALAGLLKARRGTNEVISTLLLSFIAVWMVYGSVQSEALLRQPMSNSSTLPESLTIPDTTQLPHLIADSSLPLHIGLPLTLMLACVTAFVLQRTVIGVQLRAVGLNPEAARRAGMPLLPIIVAVMGAAGALGGLAGSLMLQGDQFVLKAGFSSGYGFDGLVVGLLARGSVTRVLAAAILFGFLRSGGINMEMVAAVPTALVVVIQGLIIITLAGSSLLMEKLEAKR